jgi:elongation factor Ts
LQISTELVKTLRDKTKAGVMECRNALIECRGDLDKAIELLRKRGLAKAEKKAGRVASQGVVEAYVHPGGRMGAMIELNCETDFVARTDEFKELAHNLALQVVATSPLHIGDENHLPETALEDRECCLLSQPFIKDPSRSVKDIITETIAKVGENIKVGKFARFELGAK